MRVMIRIQPTPGRRRAFAAWAVTQRPKVRTVSPEAFAVPPEAFVTAPEDILIGALIDGHRYVSPKEDRAAGRERPQAPAELLGVARPEALTPPAPQVRARALEDTAPTAVKRNTPDAAYGQVAAPLPVSAPEEPDAAPADGDSGVEGAAHACDRCPRTFGTARGRDNHRRQVHTDKGGVTRAS